MISTQFSVPALVSSDDFCLPFDGIASISRVFFVEPSFDHILTSELLRPPKTRDWAICTRTTQSALRTPTINNDLTTIRNLLGNLYTSLFPTE